MKYMVRNIITAMAMLPALAASAQDAGSTKYAIRATAEKSLGNALAIDYAVDGMSSSSSAMDYGIDFGWKIWERNRNSIEANVGVGYGTTTINSYFPAMDYHYDAPAAADMDNDTYIRYYNLDGISQKTRVERITVPLYANYRHKFSKVFSLHALLGFRFGFNLRPKMLDSKCKVFSYGVYPQYDDLMIDASYLNEFGSADVYRITTRPKSNTMTSAFLVGAGAEFRIFGPVSIDLSVRYEGAMSSLFRSLDQNIIEFEAANAPVTYTVAEGQRMISLPSYFTLSLYSKCSAAVSLLYRF